jgi:hypothetical protein
VTVATLGSRLRELGFVLPKSPTPLGTYVKVSKVGSLLFLSATLPLVDGKLTISGRLGANLSVDQGREAARLASFKCLGSGPRTRWKPSIGEMQNPEPKLSAFADKLVPTIATKVAERFRWLIICL